MNSYDNWIYSNLKDRLLDPSLDFRVHFNLTQFNPTSFHQAADQVALDIAEKYENIFIGYSGGLDSEYIVSCFHRLNIPFTPILSLCEGGEEEAEYAYKFCKKIGKSLEVITCSNVEFLNIYYNILHRKLNGVGMLTIPAIHAATYAKKQNGIFLSGINLLGDGDEVIGGEHWLGEWDDYLSVLEPSCAYTIAFFHYKPKLIYSMIKDIIPNEGNMIYEEYKSQLYGLNIRPKIYQSLNKITISFIKSSIGNRKSLPNPKYYFGNTQQVLKIFEPYIIY